MQLYTVSLHLILLLLLHADSDIPFPINRSVNQYLSISDTSLTS